VTGDEAIGPNPVTLLFHHVLRTRMQMLFAGRSRVADLGVTDLGVTDLGSPRDFEGAFAGPGVLDRKDLGTVGRALAAALRPGAPVIVCVPRTGAQGVGLLEVRASLGPEFTWSGAFALGLVVPREARQDWVRRHPQAFGILAAVEGVVRRWPLLRAAGEYLVLEGARR
jgi:hypothetical protein